MPISIPVALSPNAIRDIPSELKITNKNSEGYGTASILIILEQLSLSFDQVWLTLRDTSKIEVK